MMKKYVSIVLCSLGIVQVLLSAIVCDYMSSLVSMKDVDLYLSRPAPFSELRCDSICTDVIIINPAIEVPIIQYEDEDF